MESINVNQKKELLKRIRFILSKYDIIFFIFLLIPLFLNILRESPALVALCFAFSLLFLLFSSEQSQVHYFLFFASFSMVFKFFSSGTSCITYLLLVFFIERFALVLMKKRKLSNAFFPFCFFVILFAVYIILIDFLHLSGISFKSLPSFFLYFLFPVFAFETSDNKELYKSSYFYIIYGLFGSMVFGIAGAFNPDIRRTLYLYIETVYQGGSFFSVRFNGLIGDPNYYTFFILAEALLFVLIERKPFAARDRVGFLLTALLLLSGLITQSKTFYIGLLLFLLFLLFRGRKMGGKTGLITLLCVGIGALAVDIFFGQQLLSTIIKRFTNSTGSSFSLDNITTNRSDLWNIYTIYFLGHPIDFFFGQGLRASVPFYNDMHNTLLRLLWDFGLFGSLLYCMTVLFSIFYRFISEKSSVPVLFLVSRSIKKYWPLLVWIFLASLVLDLNSLSWIFVFSSGILFFGEDFEKQDEERNVFSRYVLIQ